MSSMPAQLREEGLMLERFSDDSLCCNTLDYVLLAILKSLLYPLLALLISTVVEFNTIPA